jgi:two-component system chemotaxis response regulator CheB
MSTIDAAVIGCSAGGLQALQQVLALLPTDLAIPIIIVSHVGPESVSLLPELISHSCRLPTGEAEEREAVAPGHVYFAPPNYHLLIEPDRTFRLSVDDCVCHVRPAADVLFISAADAYRHRLAGLVLTGANTDGARGLRAIADVGGICLVQDPETAVADTMPRAALMAVPEAKVLTLDAMAGVLDTLSRR